MYTNAYAKTKAFSVLLDFSAMILFKLCSEKGQADTDRQEICRKDMRFRHGFTVGGHMRKGRFASLRIL